MPGGRGVTEIDEPETPFFSWWTETTQTRTSPRLGIAKDTPTRQRAFPHRRTHYPELEVAG
jgi:hypothetical protein